MLQSGAQIRGEPGSINLLISTQVAPPAVHCTLSVWSDFNLPEYKRITTSDQFWMISTFKLCLPTCHFSWRSAQAGWATCSASLAQRQTWRLLPRPGLQRGRGTDLPYPGKLSVFSLPYLYIYWYINVLREEMKDMGRPSAESSPSGEEMEMG